MNVLFTRCLLFFLSVVFVHHSAFSAQQEPANFDKLWKQVQEFEAKGLPKSALDAVDGIYQQAYKERAYGHMLKANIHHVKYKKAIEGNEFARFLSYFEDKKNDYKNEGLAVFQSVYGEFIWTQYKQQQWKINREGFSFEMDGELQVWKYKDFVKYADSAFQESISQTEYLKSIPVKQFEPIIETGTAKNERPTLYDFLINRAIDFYGSREFSRNYNGPELFFDDTLVFNPVSDFVDATLQYKPVQHPVNTVVELYQQWLAFRLENKKDTTALFFADLDRLTYFYNLSKLQNKEKYFLEALNHLAHQYPANPFKNQIYYEQAQVWYEKGRGFNQSNKEAEKLRFAWVKTRELLFKILGNNPKKKLKIEASKLLQTIEHKELRVNMQQVCPSNNKIPMLLTYKNVAKAYGRLFEIPLTSIKHEDRTYDQHERYRNLIKQAVLKDSFLVDLPDFADFRSHTLEYFLEEKKPGSYMLVFSADNEFEPGKSTMAFYPFQVSDLAYFARTTKTGNVAFYVVHRNSGEPLPKVQVNLINRNYNFRARTTKETPIRTDYTNKNGMLTVPYNKEELRGFYAQLILNGDTLETKRNFYTRHPSESKAYKRVHFFTDRAIYRPGQVVYFKGILLEQNRSEIPEIVAGHKGEVMIKDQNFQELKQIPFKTNEYGSFSGEFLLPKAMLNGEVTLSTPWGRHSIKVEEYKRPTFQVQLNKPEQQFKLNQKLVITGDAERYNGMPISGANVKYTIYRSPIRYYWWQYGMKKQQIDFGEVKTNAEGEFDLSFIAKSSGNETNADKGFAFTIQVEITDGSGETRTQELTLNVGGEALILRFEMDERINVIKEQPWVIKTLTPNGNMTKAQVDVVVHKLKSPETPCLERLWKTPDTTLSTLDKPDDINFGGHNWMEHLKIEKENIYSGSFQSDGALNITPEKLDGWTTGIYKIVAKTRDSYENDIVAEKYVTLYNGNDKKVPYPVVDWCMDENETLGPGKNASLVFGSSEKLWVLFQVEYNEEIIHQEQLKINNKVKTFNWPVTEDMRGGFAMHLTYVYKGREFKHLKVVNVPFNNKALAIKYQTFRDKLKPGAQEKWTLKITKANHEEVHAELLAGMYDASLDQFVNHQWLFNPLPKFNYRRIWQNSEFSINNSEHLYVKKPRWEAVPDKTYDRLNWFGLFGYYGRPNQQADFKIRGMSTLKSEAAPPPPTMQAVSDVVVVEDEESELAEADNLSDTMTMEDKQNNEAQSQAVRTNFNETAFFYPNLYTNDSGQVEISFTLPESLTTWNFKALAHTRQLDFGATEKQIVAQKELMAELSAPRFVTQGDSLVLPAKIQNLTEKELKGTVTIAYSHPLTGKKYDFNLEGGLSNDFVLLPKQTRVVNFNLTIPDTLTALQYTLKATAGNFTDGEQNWIPVLSNRTLVTETKQLWINGDSEKTFHLNNFASKVKSPTLTHQKMVLEFSSNPVWYAVQSLPFLMENESQCAEKVFAALYANLLVRHIIEAFPEIEKMFEQWRIAGDAAFLSELEKNESLKQILLQETPWVLDALNEKEQRQNLALLFNRNQVEAQIKSHLYTLSNLQNNDGSWSWYAGMPHSRYISQYIAVGTGRLLALGVIDYGHELMQLIQKTKRYLDNEILNDFNRLENIEQNDKDRVITNLQAQYFYIRAYIKNNPTNNKVQEAIDFFENAARKNWVKNSKMAQGMLAIYFYEKNEVKVANAIMQSIQEYAITDEEQGMYWKENTAGYHWYQAPIEFQSLMVEAFKTTGADVSTLNNLKKWLLKNKQTTHWKTSRATADAVFAILFSGSDWVKQTPQVQMKIGDYTILPDTYSREAMPGTGYFKKEWTGDKITPSMQKLSVSRSGKGISWGGWYWQYFEDKQKVTSNANEIKVTRELYLLQTSDGETKSILVNSEHPVKVGDKLKVRLTFRVDRNMEYLMLSDNRAASWEPVDVISGYRYGSGIGYYQVTRDTRTNFFIDYLPKGVYTVEYKVYATHAGSFTGGNATLQSVYAPEFSAHTQGMKVEVKSRD